MVLHLLPLQQDTLTTRFNSWASGEVTLTACTLMFPMITFFTSLPSYIGPYPMLSLSPLRSFASLPLWIDHVPFLGMRKSVSDQISVFAHPNESNKWVDKDLSRFYDTSVGRRIAQRRSRCAVTGICPIRFSACFEYIYACSRLLMFTLFSHILRSLVFDCESYFFFPPIRSPSFSCTFACAGLTTSRSRACERASVTKYQYLLTQTGQIKQ